MRAPTWLAVAVAAFVGLVGPASSAPLTLNFIFASPNTSATATGFITFDSALLSNPGLNDFFLPDPAVLDLQVTVSGASAGNGTFHLADFTEVVLDTNGGTLDFSQQLIGQPTSGNPFGTTDICTEGPLGGTGGDFNLFTSAPPPPEGIWWFTLGANDGNADCMVLQSLTAAPIQAVRTQVPTLSEWGLLALLALMAVAAGFALRRRRPSM